MIHILVLAQLLQAGAGQPSAYERGMEAARAGDWDRARQEFQIGRALFPADKRYPAELAGVEYRTGRADLAREYLHGALALDPRDSYANDFLGTLYYLDGNYEAALKYWNRIGKPRVGPLEITPGAPISPVLLDRAVAFAPGEVLRLDDYLATTAWLRDLNVFGNFRTELAAREGGEFDPLLHWSPAQPWVKLLTGMGGLPIQTYAYRFENVGRQAITVRSAVRWDAQKRRLFAAVSGPFSGSPQRLYQLYAEARSETWNLGAPEDFRLRKMEGGASFRFRPSGRFYWETGAVFAGRSYAGATAFASGFTAAHTASAGYRLASVPEYGFTIDADGFWQLGRFFAVQGGLYAKAEAALAARWRPLPEGSGYEVTGRTGFGRIFGNAPFDEAFILGRQRDDGLQLRGLVATRDGKKGRAPIGGQYFVTNFDFFKQVWSPTLLAIDVGALLDLGVVSRSMLGVSARRLAVTPGVQLRVRTPNGLAVVFSYARDPRGGGGFDASLR